MGFTDNQIKAIELRNRDILVSAAAGSGKTSVLVERIIRRICDDNPGVDVDRLLIMTFTNAAAAEMKERIREAIEDRLDELYQSQTNKEMINRLPDKERSDYPDNLKKQSVLVHNARITTIHGFCQSIIKDHFEKIGIDPNFRVGDENECKIMRIDAVGECLEEAYSEENASFLKAVECFSGSKNDEELSELILKLDNFSKASPNPSEFLERCAAAYGATSPEEYGQLECVRNFCLLKAQKSLELKKMATKAIEVIDETPAIEGYRETIGGFYECAGEVCDLLLNGEYDKTSVILKSFAPARMKPIGDKGLNESEIKSRDYVKSLKEILKKGIDKLAGDFEQSLSDNYERMSACREEVGALCRLVTRFGEIYEKKKRDKNIIDFNDMEHMALDILSKNQEVADSYREMFEEIYVDEYQDSNLTQEMLVNLIKRDEGNVFTVGDVKQSIYRFRMARPDLFIEKYEAYTDEESKQQRVLLNDNFRSRKEVINAVNEVFSAIMKKDFGKIEYDEAAMLKYGATYYDEATHDESKENDCYNAELILGCPEDMDNREFQANVIANRINRMVKGKMQIFDKNEKKLRDVKFRDFVILVRSLKGWESALRDVLTNSGIPVSVTGSEGYFATTEVQTSLAFMSVVDNPYQDIPFATVMRSPVGGFSDKEMAEVGAYCKACDNTDEAFDEGEKSFAAINDKSLYGKVKSIASCPVRQENQAAKDDKTKALVQLCKKCTRILELIEKYRTLATYTRVAELLRMFIDEEYSDYVRVMNKGAQRMANLNMLLAKAEDFGKTSFTGLYHFMQYMDQIRKYEMDYGEAGVLGEADDVVRIMTIHKSKGLEFPVCFVAGCEKSRNARDERQSVVWDSNFGLGCDYTDIERRIKKPTLIKSLIKEQLLRENLAEEIRVLYVAMTRAREKLIMVGTYKKDDPFEKVPAGIINCSSFLDMLTLAISSLNNGGENSVRNDCENIHIGNFDIIYETQESVLAGRIAGEIANESGREAVLSVIRKCRKAEEIIEDEASPAHKTRGRRFCPAQNTAAEYDKFGLFYPYGNIPHISQKLSVSDLKHRAIEEKRAAGEELVPDGQELFKETEPDKYIPKFMREEGQTEKGGTFYGTAFHRILELWDYSLGEVKPSDVSDFAQLMLQKNRLDKEQADAINAGDVAFFLNSSLGRRMKEAKDKGLLYREQPFVLGMSAEEVYPEYYSQDIPEILIQGIIDAYFVEEDGITIVDYKTDSVTNAQMLINRYKPQLEYYGRALSQITGQKIKALTIYSSRLREEIVIR